MKGSVRLIAIISLLGLFCCLKPANAVSPNLMVNGDFESNPTGFQKSITGWRRDGTTHAFHVYVKDTDPHHQFLGLNVVGDNGSVDQVVYPAKGTKYLLSFDFAARAGTSASENILDVYTGSGSSQTLLTSVSKAGNPVGGHIYNWSTYTYAFTADTNKLKLTFKSSGAPAGVSTSYLDNVVLKALPVPEASSMVLFAGLLLAGGMLIKTRRIANAV